MFTVRVTLWIVILLTILSSLLDGSGDFDVKLTRIEDGNSTVENAVNELNLETLKKKTVLDATNDVTSDSNKEKNGKRMVQDGVAEIHSSFGETVSSNSEFKSGISHRKITNAAPSVSQVDVPNRISETGQAVVFTLVDSASIELQNRASPVLPRAPDAANVSAGANASAGAAGAGKEAGTGAAAAPAPKVSHRERGTGPALPAAQPISAAAAAAATSVPPSTQAVASTGDAPPQAGGAEAAPAPEVGAAAATEQTVNNATEEPAPGVTEDNVDAAAPASPAAPDANDTAPPEDSDHYVVRAEPKQVESNDEAAAGAAAAAAGVSEGEAGAGADAEASSTTTSVPEVEVPVSASTATPAPAAVVNVSAEPEAPSVTEEAAASAEDIPSFNEWAQRQLAEAEEKKKVLNGSGAGGAAGGARQAAAGSASGSATGGAAASERPVEGGKALKLRSKNYASPDCGAKIVAANPEAVSPGAVLSSSRDEYMLNTCTNRAWFVVELCEAIQAKKVELANFELFSSSPREFTVSVSDRVQGREWRPVGRFTASEERVVQSFALTPQLFGRYVKVEVLSHHGSEHFCPLSLFRVYGTSEFEVLEKVDQATDEDGSAAGGDRLGMDGDEDDDDDEEGSGAADDEDVPLSAGEPPRNLFESYKNAVFSIVKQAAQALTKGGDVSNETVLVDSELDADTSNGSAPEISASSSSDDSSDTSSESRPPCSLCKSPRHLVVCDNCSDALYGDVFALLSCRERDLEALMASAFVADSLRESGVCARFGLSFARRRPGAPYPLPAAAAAARADPGDYFAALFPPEYVAALCNMLAIADRRVALNVSDAPNATWTSTLVRGGGGSVPVTIPVPRSTSPLEEGLESAMPAVTCTMGGGGASRGPEPCSGGEDPSPPAEDLASRIKPTKTLAKEESGEDTAVPMAPRLDGSEAPSVLATEARHEAPTATATVPTAVDDIAASVPAAPAVPAASLVANATATPTAAPAVPPAQPPVLVDEGLGDPVPTLPEAQEAEGGDGDSTTSTEEPSQENLDTLLRDLKDWDQSSEVSGGTAGTSPPPTVATPPAVPTSSASSPASATTPSAPPPTPAQKSQPQAQSVQKESVFVRLANRIKALERNMSLSGQYLEELSRRYKKQVEEMQKAFNRTLQAVHEAGRVGEEREAKWHEEMQQVQQQVLQLTGLVEDLVGERDSWLNRFSVLAQHAVLICVEVFIFVFLMYFCRRLPTLNRPLSQEVPRKVSGGIKNRKGNRFVVKRRKSVEGVSGHESPRTRNRRPSEEALHISGSYQDLLISEPAVIDLDGHGLEFGFTSTKVDSRRRRRKKKDALLRSASVRLPVRSGAPLVDVAEECAKSTSRRASSLELGVWWASNNGVEEVVESIEADPKEDDEVQVRSESLSACTELKSLPLTIENLSPHSPPVPISNSQNNSVHKKENIGSSSSSSSSESKIRSLSDTVSPLSQNNGLVRSNVSYKVKQQLSSPMFMRTATSVRSGRLGSSSVEPSPPAKLKSDNWEWYSTHHGLDKSSQPNKVKCTVSCPGNTPGESGQRQNGHTDASDGRRSSNASCSSSTSNISEGLFRKDASKKGPSSLKKMVKKFF